MLDKALSEIKDRLALDGYILKADQPEEGIVEIVIEAGPEACAECLVPKNVLEKIIEKDLRVNEVNYNKINITYP